jgi:hypothetical protein
MLLSGETVFPDVVEPPDYYLHKLEGPAEMIAKVRSVIPLADEKQNRL